MEITRFLYITEHMIRSDEGSTSGVIRLLYYSLLLTKKGRRGRRDCSHVGEYSKD